MKKNVLVYLVLVVVLTAFSLVGCSSEEVPLVDDPNTSAVPEIGEVTPKEGGVLNFSILRDPGGLDPHISHGGPSYYLNGNVYENLVTYLPDGSIIGELSDDWEQVDDVTYIFNLKQGVKFHDGSEFNADDVVATIERIKDPNTRATLGGNLSNIKEVNVKSEYTVEMVLNKPNMAFLIELADRTTYIISADDYESGFDFNQEMNGTGPFMLEDYEPNRYYEIIKNPNYHVNGKPYLDKVIMTPIPDTAARMNSIKSGEADVVEYVPWEELDSLSDFNVYRAFGTFNWIRLNTSVPPLDNVKVRQALAHIIDREAMVELAWGGFAKPITGIPQQEGDQYYFPEFENYYTTDHDKALELLKEAGYNSPADVPALKLGTTVNPVLKDTGMVALQQFLDFGLDVEFETFESPVLIANRVDGTYVMQQDGGGFTVPDPDAYRTLFHSETGTAYATGAGYKNTELDKLLEEGVRTSSKEEREKIYRQAFEILLEDTPVIFELYRVQGTAFNKNLQGYEEFAPNIANYADGEMSEWWFD